MKLITKISRYFLISSLVIFIVIAGLLYAIIEQTITNEVDEQLLNVYNKAVKELREGKEVNFPPLIEIKKIHDINTEQGFKNILLKSGEDEEEEPFRQYSSIVNVNGKESIVIVRISLIEKEDMFLAIFSVTIGAVFLFLLIIFVINKFSSQKIFRSFYSTLEKLGKFSLAKNDNLELNKSDIDEFDKLNNAFQKLSEKARDEYRSLKEFTEETNHEIQTPVSVVRSKLEVLLQSENLKEDDLNLLNTALHNLNKLERINKSILLLNKLEHKNLFEDSPINLAEEIRNVLLSFSDSVASKYISLNISLDEETVITANSSLMNILFSNLISNAIKHNIESGKIIIQLQNEQLTISNSGAKPKDNTEIFFNRFYRESKSRDSVGLGLTIAKKICDLYGLEIRNYFSEELHTTIVRFNKIITGK